MTGEERRKQLKEQMKAEFKRDLELRKAFLDQVKQTRQTRNINEALGSMVSGLQQDDSDEWIAKLNQGASAEEAKLDMAMEQYLGESRQLEQMAQQAEAEKLSAAQLLLQMKREMGLLPPEPEAAPAEAAPAPETEEKPEAPSQKRLGDF
jgi:hypothetical protein